jgi:hypothetical protein
MTIVEEKLVGREVREAVGPMVETRGDRKGAVGGSCNGGTCRCSVKIWRSTGGGIYHRRCAVDHAAKGVEH